jgi:hypothetical protein
MLEREKRIKQAMLETYDQLAKATKKRNDTIKCIEMDEVEDKAWAEYLRQDESRVTQLENHMAKLKGMLKELGVA